MCTNHARGRVVRSVELLITVLHGRKASGKARKQSSARALENNFCPYFEGPLSCYGKKKKNIVFCGVDEISCCAMVLLINNVLAVCTLDTTLSSNLLESYDLTRCTD